MLAGFRKRSTANIESIQNQHSRWDLENATKIWYKVTEPHYKTLYQKNSKNRTHLNKERYWAFILFRFHIRYRCHKPKQMRIIIVILPNSMLFLLLLSGKRMEIYIFLILKLYNLKEKEKIFLWISIDNIFFIIICTLN